MAGVAATGAGTGRVDDSLPYAAAYDYGDADCVGFWRCGGGYEVAEGGGRGVFELWGRGVWESESCAGCGAF